MNPAKEAAEKICHMTGDYPVKTERYEVIIVAAYAPLLQKARELAEQITSPVRGQFFIPRDLELARELLALLRTTIPRDLELARELLALLRTTSRG